MKSMLDFIRLKRGDCSSNCLFGSFYRDVAEVADRLLTGAASLKCPFCDPKGTYHHGPSVLKGSFPGTDAKKPEFQRFRRDLLNEVMIKMESLWIL